MNRNPDSADIVATDLLSATVIQCVDPRTKNAFLILAKMVAEFMCELAERRDGGDMNDIPPSRLEKDLRRAVEPVRERT